MKRYIVGLGEALWDVLPEGKKIGGAPANFAYHAGQWGFDSMAVSAVGKDWLGAGLLDTFAKIGLNYEMPYVFHPTGTVQVELDENGVPTYDIRQDVAWDNIPMTSKIEEIARNCLAVCWGSLAQRSEASRETIARFLELTPEDALRVFDMNLRQNFYSKEVLEESMKYCDVLKLNDEELVTVSRMFDYGGLDDEAKCRRLIADYGLKILVLTCGTNGSYVFTSDKKSFRETPKVEVADTVGAGDSFTGTFCAAILRDKPIEEAHRLAVNVSAYVCTQNGAMPTIPDELKK